jgi:hypothetical protein
LSKKKKVEDHIGEEEGMINLFEEMPGGLKNILTEMACAGEGCIGLLILHNEEEGTWSYSTNLSESEQVLEMLSEMSEMVKSDIDSSGGVLH